MGYSLFVFRLTITHMYSCFRVQAIHIQTIQYYLTVLCFLMVKRKLSLSDIRELIHIDDAMEDEALHFGPNGGLVFCME